MSQIELFKIIPNCLESLKSLTNELFVLRIFKLLEVLIFSQKNTIVCKQINLNK